jgi:protein-disulfide isomerase
MSGGRPELGTYFIDTHSKPGARCAEEVHAIVKSTILLGVSAVVALAPGLWAQTNPQRQPIARIGDEVVYDEDLLPSIRAQLLQLKSQEYELKIRALENLVNQRLLEAEAKAKSLPVEAFLMQTVDQTVAVPTEKEIEAYYLAQKDRLNRPLQEVKPQLQEALTQARRQQARQEYMEGLRRKSTVAILLARPRIEVTADPSRLRGNPKAPVTIVEFSDFQCPYCRAAQPTIKELLDKYKDKVRLGYRDYPLRQIHPQAQQAAEASRCAAEQGKFWEFHDLLYADQSKLDQPGLTDNARIAGLDVGRFSACFASGKFKAAVEEDLQTGATAGVSGTPAFYINGVILTGAQAASAFERIIDTEISAVQSKRKDQ